MEPPPALDVLAFNVNQVEGYGLPGYGRLAQQRNSSLLSNNDSSRLDGSKLYCGFLSQMNADDLLHQVNAQTVYVDPELLAYRGVCPQGISRSFQCDLMANSVSYCRAPDFNRTMWRPFTSVALQLRDLVHQATGQRPNSMICTLSQTKETHNIVSRMHLSGDLERGSRIFILSLGATATLRLRPHQEVYETQSIALQHGTLFELSEQTRISYDHSTMTKSTSADRIELVFCAISSRFLPNDDIAVLGSNWKIYRWQDNIRQSLGILRPLDPARLQAEDLVRMTTMLAGGHVGASDHELIATARHETSEICDLCGRDALPKDICMMMPYAPCCCVDCAESWGQPQYKVQEDAVVKELNDARQVQLAAHEHTVADAERRVDRSKVRLRWQLSFHSTSTWSGDDNELLLLMHELEAALSHLNARQLERRNIPHAFPPWSIAPFPAAFTPFPPFTTPLTLSPLGRVLEDVARHIAPWILENRDTIKALPRSRVLLWGEPLQVINHRFLDAGHRVPGGVECRVDDARVVYRYEDEDEPPTDMLMFWDDCPADEIGDIRGSSSMRMVSLKWAAELGLSGPWNCERLLLSIALRVIRCTTPLYVAVTC